jgi:hypothetical protein
METRILSAFIHPASSVSVRTFYRLADKIKHWVLPILELKHNDRERFAG